MSDADPMGTYREQGFVGDPARPQVDPQSSHQQSAAEETLDGLTHQQEGAREYPAPAEGLVTDGTAAAQDPTPEAQAAGTDTTEEATSHGDD